MVFICRCILSTIIHGYLSAGMSKSYVDRIYYSSCNHFCAMDIMYVIQMDASKCNAGNAVSARYFACSTKSLIVDKLFCSSSHCSSIYELGYSLRVNHAPALL